MEPLRQKSMARLIGQPLLVAVVLALAARAAVRIYSIPSNSMAPALRAGDHIAATPYVRASPKRGEVIVFRSPVPGEEVAVKRVIGLPGDLVESKEGRLRISGRTVAEPYIVPRSFTSGIAPQLVPAGHLFLLGDNRADSLDSRHWGPLPQERVLGRARLILWSSDSSAGSVASASTVISSSRRGAGVRTERIFKCIR